MIDFNLRPAGYEPLADEPDFAAKRDLALEAPRQTASLSDFGYAPNEVAACPSDFAVTSVFRLLSDEGAARLYEVCKRLEVFAAGNPRIERCVRGGVYRSAFLRDLCISPEVAEFLSKICGVALLPHTIPHQLGHINYAPKTAGKNVDKWHVDTLRYDYVMFVTDPKKNKGGAFQYFCGRKQELAELKKRGEAPPANKVVSPAMPGAGYAVFQQGNMVAHQAKGLDAPGERITMVNGYIVRDPAFPDYTRYDQLLFADPPEVATAEYARHIALQARRLLAQQFDAGELCAGRAAAAERLDAAARLLAAAAGQIRNSDSPQMEHFGD